MRVRGADPLLHSARGGSGLAQQSQAAIARPQDGTRRQERAERILDAAAALILRWGYNKTTIDDIARQAGVAKGTIYLHWNTREELFAALMKREKAALSEDVRQRPLLKAVLLRDLDVIGKLAHREQSSAAYAERLAGFTTYLAFLREHELVRTDLSLRAQLYMVSAIFMGFFLVAPLMPGELTLSDEELAELLAETVQRALESGRAVASDEAQTGAQAFQQYLDRATAIADEQFQRAVE